MVLTHLLANEQSYVDLACLGEVEALQSRLGLEKAGEDGSHTIVPWLL